jgi:Rrf2 family protein
MASEPERAFTSGALARFAETNPVVVRRTLGHLREAGLVKSSRGHAGGWLLSRQPEAVTLAMVYRALDERLSIGPKAGNENPSTCKIEQAVGSTFQAALSEAEKALIAGLEKKTLASLI